MTLLQAKQSAGAKAAELIQEGMIVGLGTGSTATCFIEALIEKKKKGLFFRAVASSKASADLARTGGIDILDLNSVSTIDLTVDGADEVDLQKRMIKGKGGAHVREKILAVSSKEMIVIIDETKYVSSLGKTPLPVEILPYGAPLTRARLEKCGFQGEWRKNPKTNSLFITENGNLLLDISFTSPLSHPEEIELKIRRHPGVVDTGFFFGIAGRIIIGYQDGKVNVLS